MPQPNTFSGARIDRVATERRRDAAWVAAQRDDPAARALVVGRRGVLLDGEAPARVPLAEAPDGGAGVLLGLEPSGPLFAVDAGADGAGPMVGLREVAARLAQEEGGLVAYAAALLNWHRTHPHCAVCGARTEVAEAGLLRVCPRCGAQHHPRTDPVVIMLVLDGDRALLGRQASWDPGRYSALAGFVEPGESLEEAVARECLEESGVQVEDARYVSSQPWPFPSSLMLGFTATYAGGEAHAREGELEDARWFTRAELDAAAEGRGPFGLPPRLAIARRLIDGWRGAEPW